MSPSVQTAEVDLTARPQEPEQIGSAIVGRFKRGPAFVPVQVNDEKELLETFGEPIPGNGLNGDVWRDGNYTAPTYAAYGAYGYLKSKGPVTIVRMLGDQHEQATTSGAAGWPQDGNYTPNAVQASNAGAYGLFVFNSGSLTDYQQNSEMTGALGAIFYLKEGSSIRLQGEAADSTNNTNDESSGACEPYKNSDVNKTFTAVIKEGSTATTASFNFQPDSDKFIRKVFNTNPILTNSDVVSSTSANYRQYWLGETFENFVERQVPSGSVTGSVFGIILPLVSSSNSSYGGDFRYKAKRGRTGWVIAQDLTNNYSTYQPELMTKLFRFKTLTPDEWCQKNLKISISNVKSAKNLSNPYGKFDVEIRMVGDNDQSKKVVERFTECDLNPNSNNYIAKKIGDMYMEWDYTNRVFVEYGNYVNRSKFFYVEMNTEVDEGLTDSRLLPFGFYGTPRFHGITMTKERIFNTKNLENGIVAYGQSTYAVGSGSSPHAASGSAGHLSSGIVLSKPGGSTLLEDISASVAFPTHKLVVSASSVNANSPFNAYFGIDVYREGSNRILAEDHVDIVRSLPDDIEEGNDATEYSYYFSLDDVRQASASNGTVMLADAFYESGSRKSGLSLTATGSRSPLTTLATSSYESVLTAGFNKFTMPVYGGFEGLDVAEKEPFRNTFLEGGSETTNYAYHSVQRCIESLADPEVVEYELIAAPGITNESLTRRMLDIAEERADSLAIIDLKGDYVPSTENTSTEASRRGNVDTVISNLKDRGINSSYGCSFYPWLKIRDIYSDTTVDIPPSVVALGTFASTDKNAEPWFAPAGFNRGGLSKGVAGLDVVGIKDKLTKPDRDKLYEANINPIGQFPNEGLVILGQKTLQVTPSALDRINVRRLMLLAKKRISGIARNLLFDQNVRTTWRRFESQVEPFLRSIKARFGLSDFRVVLDEKTTTADLIDRNIMYAQIWLKPARAIEYIAIDFILQPTGASFED